ncbi:hypothetical protein HOLleu_30878 [Holothuria leucospilota]|uniref:Cytoskeleton-associated protein 2-like n=1 Tax=Holothuria leucospilota TaxID=206669 RepID=A0A9Q1H1I0_HOLLE|nr:hypothetical protein HOLleu_30878 [Holothuria leucospilota]
MKTVKGQSECPEKHPSQRLDGCRSPSMWEKLAKWKAEKENLKRNSSVKTSSRQPFKVGRTQMRRGKVPARASEKIKLLVESNLNTNWTYRTSPRYSSCRKSVSHVKKSLCEKKLSSSQSVRKPHQARRETITLSAGDNTFSDKNICSHLNFKENDEKDIKVVPKERQKLQDRKLQSISKQKSSKVTKPRSSLQSKDIRSSNNTSSQKTLTNSKQKAQREGKLQKKKVEDKSVSVPAKDQTVSVSEEQTKLRLKLEQWLLAKGRTPSRATRFMKTPRAVCKVKQRVHDETHSSSYSNVLSVDEAMDACKDLLKEGCPPEYLSDWLDGLSAKLPCLQEVESFVSCRNLVLFAANDVAMTTHSPYLTSNSVEHQEEDSADAKKPASHQRRKSRRSSYQLLSPCEEVEESSVLKYQVREATPYFKRIHQALGQTSSTPSTMIVTPVRRSMRLSKRKSVSFASRQNNQLDTCVDSLNELPCGQEVQVVLRANRALEEEFGLVDEEPGQCITNNT